MGGREPGRLLGPERPRRRPAAEGDPAAYYSASTNTKHVLYRASRQPARDLVGAKRGARARRRHLPPQARWGPGGLCRRHRGHASRDLPAATTATCTSCVVAPPSRRLSDPRLRVRGGHRVLAGSRAAAQYRNVQTRAQALDVDDFGRVLTFMQENDRARSDDDLCVTTTYATPTEAAARVLGAPASRRLWDCREGGLHLRQRVLGVRRPARRERRGRPPHGACRRPPHPRRRAAVAPPCARSTPATTPPAT